MLKFLRKEKAAKRGSHWIDSGDAGMFYHYEIKPYDDIIFFIREVYEVAFGYHAINKEYSKQEVIDKLKEHSENAWKYKELG